jgi:hypothetical protein
MILLIYGANFIMGWDNNKGFFCEKNSWHFHLDILCTMAYPRCVDLFFNDGKYLLQQNRKRQHPQMK